MSTYLSLYAELKTLAKNAKGNIYDMLSIACRLLDDDRAVLQLAKKLGVDGHAGVRKHIEEQEFSFFGGTPSLAAMIRAFKANPEKKIWQEYHFNVRAMIALATPAEGKRDRQRPAWKEKAEKYRSQIEEKDAEIATLRKEIEQLKRSNSELQGKLSVYENGSTARRRRAA